MTARPGVLLVVVELPQHFAELAELIGFIGQRWPDARLTTQDLDPHSGQPVGYTGSMVIEVSPSARPS